MSFDRSEIAARIEQVRRLADENSEPYQQYEAAHIAQSVVYDTAGSGHPLMRAIDEAVKSGDWTKVVGACLSVVSLFDNNALPSPGLRIAHEIEGSLLDIAQAQAQLAETAKD